ncbi:AEC family transporter [Moraxella pluranimalium]|uniref:Malonate transporter n=1 Tax=Moraxella pluranimalium TaxID=470453 RepID=A0A1T0CQR6_9GAMM|nr:AEC family transporter [Moraxella pluranimalium]OOS24708.1 malonate transporter [Moraxella pluranimalium]
MLDAIVFAISITLPNLILMGLGFMMQKRSVINPGFIEVASKMVFSYCLPCLLFFSVIKSDVDYAKQVNLLTAGLACTFALFILAELYAKFLVKDVADKGVFVQGVFRSNMAIMSLAVVSNAYGNEGLGIGAVYMGMLTIVYNILAVITLSRTMQSGGGFVHQAKDVLLHIIKNPLIIALVSAFGYKALALPELPKFAYKTGELLGAVALPLALICAGATLNVKSMLSLSGVSMQASIGRIVVAPLMAVAFGLAFSLAPIEMGVLFLMVASPAAAASYVMAKAMGGNDVLAANILGFTTVMSMLGMAVGMAMLRIMGLV